MYKEKSSANIMRQDACIQHITDMYNISSLLEKAAIYHVHGIPCHNHSRFFETMNNILV